MRTIKYKIDKLCEEMRELGVDNIHDLYLCCNFDQHFYAHIPVDAENTLVISFVKKGKEIEHFDFRVYENNCWNFDRFVLGFLHRYLKPNEHLSFPTREDFRKILTPYLSTLNTACGLSVAGNKFDNTELLK